jgi:hypothetical protein
VHLFLDLYPSAHVLCADALGACLQRGKMMADDDEDEQSEVTSVPTTLRANGTVSPSDRGAVNKRRAA